MKFWEAMKALDEGKKVRCVCFKNPKAHICLDETGLVSFQCESWPLGGYLACDWELYEEPQKTYTFMEVVQGLKEGKKFIRKDRCGDGDSICFLLEDFEATDWIELK